MGGGTDLDRRVPDRRPTGVRALQLLVLVGVAVFAASTLPGVRSEPGFQPVLDGWLQGAMYVLAAALAVTRAAAGTRERPVWALVAAALTARALGFVLFLGVVRWQVPVPYPSVADAAWLTSVVLLAAALVVLIRRQSTNLSHLLLLDGIVAAAGAAAIGLTLLDRVTPPGDVLPAAVAVNFAYPVLDAVLLVLVLGVLVAVRWRPSRSLTLLALGVAGFTVVDSVFLAQQLSGTFRPGTLLPALSMVVTAAMAWAGWAPGAWSPPKVRPWRLGLVLPVVFSLSCLVLLVVATQRPVPVVAVTLATTGAAIAMIRTVLTFRDVRAVAEAQRDARTDELTGVANRRAFNESIQEFLDARAGIDGLALLVVDLNDFKAVNDAWGHSRGDEILIAVAERLDRALAGDGLLTRLGGDEFAVLLLGDESRRATSVANRLGDALRAPFPIGGQEVRVSASIGIAVHPHDGQDASELLQHADLAMYGAKSANAGYARFSADLHRARTERAERVARLRRAISDGEIVLAYQPQVDLRTGVPVAVEALVRWQHPDRGLLPPEEFLRHAESGGLMRELTREVLDQALRQCAVWSAAGRPLTVAVNLSVSNLLDPQFPDDVARALRAHAVPARLLVLELTEDLFLADQERAAAAMSALSDVGVTLVVDDYGTGYSSLSYLRDLRMIGGLKVDRSFVADICHDERVAAILQSTVGLADSLRIRLVAEGVETTDVRDRLAELGCTVAQGYLFSRPIPADDVSTAPLRVALASRWA